jgi:ABC-type antimicrobial peptide transport system permease subunit
MFVLCCFLSVWFLQIAVILFFTFYHTVLDTITRVTPSITWTVQPTNPNFTNWQDVYNTIDTFQHNLTGTVGTKIPLGFFSIQPAYIPDTNGLINILYIPQSFKAGMEHFANLSVRLSIATQSITINPKIPHIWVGNGVLPNTHIGDSMSYWETNANNYANTNNSNIGIVQHIGNIDKLLDFNLDEYNKHEIIVPTSFINQPTGLFSFTENPWQAIQICNAFNTKFTEGYIQCTDWKTNTAFLLDHITKDGTSILLLVGILCLLCIGNVMSFTLLLKFLKQHALHKLYFIGYTKQKIQWIWSGAILLFGNIGLLLGIACSQGTLFFVQKLPLLQAASVYHIDALHIDHMYATAIYIYASHFVLLCLISLL